jgi:hypothetical protein
MATSKYPTRHKVLGNYDPEADGLTKTATVVDRLGMVFDWVATAPRDIDAWADQNDTLYLAAQVEYETGRKPVAVTRFGEGDASTALLLEGTHYGVLIEPPQGAEPYYLVVVLSRERGSTDHWGILLVERIGGAQEAAEVAGAVKL